MRTIARGTKKMLAVKAEFTEIKVYDASSGEMIPADADRAWQELFTRDKARLVESSDATKYFIRIHSNRWYELTRPAEAPTA
ncbi:hypothetical protein EV284_3485 [Streptomyces sp. BK022]|uniref:hypothetical protein n=1 Tax=Streptomyces sp. BK022 TaxID=2512123 RepID=UPI001029666A|nr:hypothetical protein [Streptomyces sp. BK022]RZU36002.1 hypothetical protein EV284_3485 [Streptomyces sp. BK022]